LSSHSASAAGRAELSTRAVLVGVDVGGSATFDASLDELALLAASAGDLVVARVTAKRRAPDPALFVGSGKADEIKALVAATAAHGVQSGTPPGRGRGRPHEPDPGHLR
jgi:GTPase